MSKARLWLYLGLVVVCAGCDGFGPEVTVCLGEGRSVIPEGAHWGRREMAVMDGLCGPEECTPDTPLSLGVIENFRIILKPEFASDVDDPSTLRIASTNPDVVWVLSGSVYDSWQMDMESEAGECTDSGVDREISVNVEAKSLGLGGTELQVLLDDRVIESFSVSVGSLEGAE